MSRNSIKLSEKACYWLNIYASLYRKYIKDDIDSCVKNIEETDCWEQAHKLTSEKYPDIVNKPEFDMVFMSEYYENYCEEITRELFGEIWFDTAKYGDDDTDIFDIFALISNGEYNIFTPGKTFSENGTETTQTIVKPQKIYAVTMENDDMNPEHIAFASTEEIANEMVETMQHTDGFEYNLYKIYSAPVDFMEINDEPVGFGKFSENQTVRKD